MNKQQKVILVSIVLFLLGGLTLAAYLALQVAKPTPRAAENEATFTLKPSNPTPEPGEEITVALFATPPANATKIRTLSAYIKYSGSIRISEVIKGTQTPFDQWDYLKARDNPSKSRIEILAAYKPLEAEPDSSGYLSGDTTAQFATIKLVWGEHNQQDITPGVLEFETAPATTGAKDPDGNDIPVSTSNLIIPVIGGPTIGEGALRLEPSSGEYKSGQTFKTQVLFDTNGEDVTSVDALIRYDSRIIDVLKVEPGTAFPQNFKTEQRDVGLVYAGGTVQNPRETVKGDGLQLATITWQALPEITLPKGRKEPGTEPGIAPPLVTTEIKFDCTPGNTDDSNITGADRNATDILNCAKITNGTYKLQFPSFPTDKASLYLSPPRGRASAGEMFTATVFLNTGGNDVSGVDAALTFDPYVLNVVSTTKGNIPEFIAYFENINNEEGRVTVSALISPDVTQITPGPQTAEARPTPRANQKPVNGQGLKFATITFKALPIMKTPEPVSSSIPGPIPAIETPINFDFTPGDKNDSNIAEYNKGGDVLAATHGAKYTISFEPIEGTSLKLKLELCDESSQRKVYLTLPNDTLIETNLNGKNENKAHTTDPVNIPAGTQSIKVRVAGYLAHTFKLPSSWTSIIDLSNSTLLAGDLDGSGKINVLDFNLFKSDYLKAEETPADLDCSDQVNSLDYDGIIRNWNKVSN